MKWVQDPSQSNANNLNNVRHKSSMYFRNKKMEYLKVKIEELATNSKIKNIWDLYRGINDFKKGYQPRTNMVKYEKGDLVTDFHRILNRWRSHFSLLLNVQRVNDARWNEIQHSH